MKGDVLAPYIVERVELEWSARVRSSRPGSTQLPGVKNIIAVGAGRMNDKGERMEMTLKAKDRVLFSSYAGSEIKLDGEDYMIMSEDEILAVID